MLLFLFRRDLHSRSPVPSSVTYAACFSPVGISILAHLFPLLLHALSVSLQGSPVSLYALYVSLPYTVKKRFTSFPSPAGMSLTKLPLGRNNSVMTSLFPHRESLVVTSRLGTGNSRTFFYGVGISILTHLFPLLLHALSVSLP